MSMMRDFNLRRRLIRPSKGGGTSILCTPSSLQSFALLFTGFLLGSVAMYNLHVYDNTSSTTSSGGVDVDVAETNGWHNIAVYYGPDANEGLKIQDIRNNPNQWFSQVHQDEIIFDLLSTTTTTTNPEASLRGDYESNKNLYFIDLAANDAKEFSNTLALEQRGWNGLCIEPNPTYWYGLSHRKCAVAGALVGGPVPTKVDVKFRGVYGGIMGKMDNRLANHKKEPDAATEQRYTAPLKEILTLFHVPKIIDYMSLDIEGAEYLVMQHFPFSERIIRILTIERPSKELQTLLHDNGYVELPKLSWWGETMWTHKSTGLTADHPKLAKWKNVIAENNRH